MNRDLSTAHIWSLFQAGVQGLVNRNVAIADDVDDIVQDIFVRIHSGASTIRDEERVQSWVFGIARRAIADHYRKQYRRPSHESFDHKDLQVSGSEITEFNLDDYQGDHSVHEEVLSWLEPTIEELPEKYAEAVRLSDIEGLSQKEIADKLDISYSGAKSRVQRGRTMLCERICDCCRVEFGTDGDAVEFRRR